MYGSGAAAVPATGRGRTAGIRGATAAMAADMSCRRRGRIIRGSRNLYWFRHIHHRIGW